MDLKYSFFLECLTFVASGECVTCGANTYGQLGYQRQSGHTLPAVVDSLAGERVQHVSCGDTFTVACTDGENEAWYRYEVTSVLCRRRGILMGQSKKRTARERYRPRHDHSSCCTL